MRLLLDECIGHRSLQHALEAYGHDVARSVDGPGPSASDFDVFAFAREHNRIVVTYNNADFLKLANAETGHSGVLLVYLDNTSSDMTVGDIVQAIANVESTYGDDMHDRVLVLNQFRWPLR